MYLWGHLEVENERKRNRGDCLDCYKSVSVP